MTNSAPPTQGKTPAGDPGPRNGGPDTRPGLYMGRPFGVPVYVSPSWFLVAILVTVMFEGQVNGVIDRPLSYLVAFAYAVLLYGSVFVHELSHAVTARVLGLPVRSVTLHILGGETSIEREAATPGREFLIAFAGPLVNLVLAGLGLLAHAVLPLPDVALLLIDALTFANLLVGVFNLLPGLPLDGGRLVRAAVWKATGHSRSGAIFAGWVGRAVAVACLVSGAYLATYRTDEGGNGGFGWLALLWSALVASFIWVGATQAIRAERFRDRVPLLSARRLARRATLVTADTPLAEAIRRAHADQAGALVIADHDGNPQALVSEKAVTATPEHRRPWITVGELSRGLEPDLTLPADLTGEDLITALRRNPASEYLLTEPDGRVYGVLAVTDVDRAFAGV
ncbi:MULTISPECIES: site-2 protease family protein [Actinomadura]|uniref:Zinc metalloprotease n=1 Tax=Actinomadura montaniterrae TaxID=1803903 RepID=A0A6L3VSG1_9ACTN|nr:site-2 protease family protein [Actinomadura montaniterrae]KAB2379647.1 site-2 protease family protein [Actinomadura montaniterrae]